MAPPKGNSNAIRHGLRAVATLPPGCNWVRKRLVQFRQSVEGAIVDTHGEVDLFRAATLQTAVRWEAVAQLAARWLREAGDTLSPTDKLTFVRQAAMASESRDRSLKALGLDKSQVADLDNLYRRPLEAAVVDPVAGDSEHPSQQHNASGERTGDCAACKGGDNGS